MNRARQLVDLILTVEENLPPDTEPPADEVLLPADDWKQIVALARPPPPRPKKRKKRGAW